MDSNHNILLLDGDEQSALDIQRFLKVSAYTFSINHAPDVQEGLDFLRSRKPDIVLLDSALTASKDFDALKQAVTKAKIPVILLSSQGAVGSKLEAEGAGATDYIIKNKINLFHLQKTILNTLRVSEAEAKLGNSFSQNVQQQAVLYKLLDKTGAAMVIVSAAGLLLYANERAYILLSDEAIKGQLVNHLTYRKLKEETFVELRPGNLILKIRTSEIDWNGEAANLFVIETYESSALKKGLLDDESFTTMLNSLS